MRHCDTNIIKIIPSKLILDNGTSPNPTLNKFIYPILHFELPMLKLNEAFTVDNFWNYSGKRLVHNKHFFIFVNMFPTLFNTYILSFTQTFSFKSCLLHIGCKWARFKCYWINQCKQDTNETIPYVEMYPRKFWYNFSFDNILRVKEDS